VERVAKINAWREAQKAEANAARAMNPATVVHREYPTVPGTDLPNERGLRWVEMRSPQELPAGWREETREGRKWFFDPEGKAHNVDSDPRYAVLEDALKYEGETMGHCVGGSGYCQGVLSGQKRIYSLRDAKGQPHVTIEVQPMRGAELGRYAADLPDGPDLEAMKNPPLKIIQIKGKGNRKPNEEYLPFVQDFVQSGQWSEVGDIRNADMFKLPDNRFVTRKRFEEAIKKLSGKNTPATEVEWLSDQINRDPSWWKNVKPAFDEPAPVRQHKMLQGIYRGYAGEGNPAAAKVYGTPQRRVAEHYAQTRAAQTGQPPHMEMLMIDPFDVNKSYGHAPATQANQEPMVTQAKQLLPSQIKGRTQLYKKGGAVTADDMRYELMRNR
jgi:hypothetical protein